MDNGAHFYRCDFQVHTPRDLEWRGPKPTSEEDRFAYAETLIEACRSRELDAIAITDHHDLAFFPFVRRAAQEEVSEEGTPVPESERIVVFPGVELTLSVPCQAILILDADFPQANLSLVLNALTINPGDSSDASAPEPKRLKKFNTPREVCDALDEHEEIKGRYILLPNVGRNTTFSLLRQGLHLNYADMPCVGGYVDGAISKLDTGKLEILQGKKKEWGNKRLAVFQTSDSRSFEHENLGSASSWVKWATPTAEAIRQACLAQESRVTHSAPSIPSVVITAIHVSNSKFMGPIDLALNPQYTAIIGGRGSGKSTILEYLRWALCDHVPSFDDQTLPNYEARRKGLIEDTLASIDASVDVHFDLNGIAHVVRRRSGSNELLLKIGSAEFEATTEAKVRSLLPIEAYSQKQLSNVSTRVEELARFVEAPIREALADIDRRIEDITERTRECFARLRRVREAQQGIDADSTKLKSVTEQADNIRKTLSGTSKEDQEVLSARTSYEDASGAVRRWEDDAAAFATALQDMDAALAELPAVPDRDINELPESDLLTSIREEHAKLVTDLRAGVKALIARTEDLADPEGEHRAAVVQWEAAREKFDAEYEEAKQRTAAHKSQLDALEKLESSSASLRERIAEKKKELASFGDPEPEYAELRESWKACQGERSELLSTQCERLTELSGEYIRASLTRGVGLSDSLRAVGKAVTGSGFRQAKLDSLGEQLLQDGDPLSMWEGVVGELELLASYDPEEEASTPFPVTPVLSKAGWKDSDLKRVAGRLSLEAWLDIALTPVRDQPSFEYRVREGDYISFARASAGQQATSLLHVLLNLPGPPLVIDQPEDDLDSQIVLEVVEQIWRAKSSRQLVFASHNANLVVNGDAELVVCCDYRVAGDHSSGTIKEAGAIDVDSVRREIIQVMDGGEDAFKLRRDKYGF